jgi:pimeloyl-ACP methyl ester carboxylesterase
MEKNPPRLPGYQLPTRPHLSSGRQAEGFFTPQQDRMPLVISIPPKRVLPIIFLPGIMGSNLRMSAARQAQVKKKNNIAWRPESVAEANALLWGNPAFRQNQLDPLETEVDEYDPVGNPTGNSADTADQRHENAKVGINYIFGVGIDTPLLMDDPVTAQPRKTKEQKARERGWGEIFFESYRDLLEMCELRLNTAFRYGKMDSWWKEVVDVAPAKWQSSPHPRLDPLDEKSLRDAVTNCWFPVHAMGYNWLQSNGLSAVRISQRITALISRYSAQGFQCQKVIVVTHSMGGLVARALIHPDFGNMRERVLGIVHGVMPATGAGAAYKRMRCGFEDPGVMSPFDSVTAKVLGNFGSEVTAVLGNSQGGLELLPNQAYGNGWLQVRHRGNLIKSLPQTGDPYEEIYKLRGTWYGLLREEWINPARQNEAGYARTARLLDRAKVFHNAIANTYHDQSFAHYGAGLAHAAWHNVVWELGECGQLVDADKLQIMADDRQGTLKVSESSVNDLPGTVRLQVVAKMAPAIDAGDQTVPLHSAEHQLQSGKFKGIFRQTGYEHQNSYHNEGALHSTLYSLIRIAQTMKWEE